MILKDSKLISKCKDPDGIKELLIQAELLLKTRQTIWSPFVSAPLREEAMLLMAPFNDFYWHSDGGHPLAERQRMQCIRKVEAVPLLGESAPIEGIELSGNFLYDTARSEDFRNALKTMGIKVGSIGDIWLIGDRGAQALCTPEAAKVLNGKTGIVRDIQIKCEALTNDQLKPPTKRFPKKLQSVEASTRLDAIASAGYGLSRAKILDKIKKGQLRLNWKKVSQASKLLVKGDLIKLENKGTIEVLSLEQTKKERWRIELLRQ